MQADKTTLNDLSIFNAEEEQSIFHCLNFTNTNAGKEYLRFLLGNTLNTITDIEDTQNTIQHLQKTQLQTAITNGTIMVIERFYDTPINTYPSNASFLNAITYKVFNSVDYSLTKYSVEHSINFIKGFNIIATMLENSSSKKMQTWQQKIQLLLSKPAIQNMLQEQNVKALPITKIINYGRFLKNNFKYESFELIEIYAKLDAYLSLAKACTKFNFCFPSFIKQQQPFVQAQNLYHILLQTPVSYTVQLMQDKNFLFLTGANMAGKSTFIKAVGVAVYLAHIGMGVPAQNMQLSLFNGLLSNIHVMDNIAKGESYFFNEVQRIKNTIEKINDEKNWLILIDELFKGTNVQDAMKCSTTVIEGLRKMNSALFILSTHLYEIADDLKQYSNLQFKYFETTANNEQLVFNYQLKDGVSNDRLGYLILKREGVVDLLNSLK